MGTHTKPRLRHAHRRHQHQRPTLHCFFTAATADYIECHPPAQPSGVGYRFDRESVLSIDPERWDQSSAQVRQPPRSSHPVWISSIIVGGIIVGVCATRTTDAGQAAEAGLIGALITGAIGAPLAFMPRASQTYGPPPYGIGIPFRMRSHPHAAFRLRAWR